MPVLPNKLAEFVQAKCGLTPDALLKLTESLGRVNEDLKVARRRKVAGKNYSKLVGKILTIANAVSYEKERVESRLEKEQRIHELLDEEACNELFVHWEVSDSIYPQRLAPSDIVRSVDSAAEKLDALDRERTVPPKVYSPREETVLDVITLIKKQEALRIAKRIADRQRAYIFNNPLEVLEAEYAEWLRKLKGEPPPETEEERLAREEAERLAASVVMTEEERRAAEEAARNFEDLADVRTLLDEAAELIRTNPEAAAAIIRQWIGNAMLVERS